MTFLFHSAIPDDYAKKLQSAQIIAIRQLCTNCDRSGLWPPSKPEVQYSLSFSSVFGLYHLKEEFCIRFKTRSYVVWARVRLVSGSG